MSKFYTSVERYGNDIMWRGYDNGKPIKDSIKFKPSLYKKTEKEIPEDYYRVLSTENDYGKKVEYAELRHTNKKPLGESGNLIKYTYANMKWAKWDIDNNPMNTKVYGNTNYIAQFIREKFPNKIKYDMSKINIFMFDIEVDISTGKPNMNTADKPITSIALKSSKRSEYVLLGLKDYDKTLTETGIDPDLIRFVKFESEQDLLAYFIKIWTNDFPDIVTGWNVEYFDIQYLLTRILRIFGEDKMKSLSPWNIVKQVSKEMYGKEQKTYHIYGMSILDYMDAFKKFGYKYGTQESYKLDHVAHVVLGERKLSYEEYGNLTTLYEKNPQKYLDYNLKDTNLIVKFEEETALLALVVTVAYDGGCNFKEAFGTVGIWDTILYRRQMNKNEVPPIKGDPGQRSDDLVGGFVKEPKPGMYRWIVSFDLNSLYPHLMMQYNMSPETIIKGGGAYEVVKEINKNSTNPTFSSIKDEVTAFIESGKYSKIYNDIGKYLLDPNTTDEDIDLFRKSNTMHNFAICANGTLFTKEYEGMIPQIIDEKYAERKAVKDEMLLVENDIEEIQTELEHPGTKPKFSKYSKKELKSILRDKKIEAIQCHNKQMSVKILMNSLYGATANIYFIYYIMEMAEAITKSGQLSVQWSAKYVNKYMNKVLKTNDVDYVVYIDTDSIYINMEPLIVKVFGTTEISRDEGEKFLDTVCKEKIEKVIDDSYEDLYNILGAYKNSMKMKREKINDTALFVSKKRYVLNTLNSEGVHYDTPKVSITGLEAVRSSTPEVCRDKLKKSFQIVMNEDERKTQEFIKEFMDEFKNMPADKIGKNTGTDNIEKYVSGNSYAKGTPGHVRGCIIYNNMLKSKGLDNKYNLIQSGDKVKFVYLKLPNPTRENLIAFPEILPQELGLDKYIDYDTQFEKVFLSPVDGLLKTIGWKSEKKDSIIDMFDD